ncbi:MAG TPA: response regulator transcription factor [Thermoanaerobaculia bacterium]|nr:response regulator transcription factor [Thermoanaerobaculia bacterium]
MTGSVPRRPRVLVTGEYPLVRTAFARLIAADPGLTVAGECANDADALAEVMNSTSPDVVVIDVDCDRRTLSPELMAQLFVQVRPRPVLVLTAHDEQQWLSAILRQGALGIVLKHRTADVLIRGIRAVLAGEAWIEPSMLTLMFGGAARPPRDAHLIDTLTPREREIVALVSLGLKNRKIAERLFISETTVRHHLTSIFNKLSVTSRLELMRYAYSTAGAGTFVPDRDR